MRINVLGLCPNGIDVSKTCKDALKVKRRRKTAVADNIIKDRTLHIQISITLIDRLRIIHARIRLRKICCYDHKYSPDSGEYRRVCDNDSYGSNSVKPT